MRRIPGHAHKLGFIVLLILGIIINCSHSAGAEEKKTVVEELLDILRAQGTITNQQYTDLLHRAREERAELVQKTKQEQAQVLQKTPAEEKAQEPQTTDFRAYWKDGIRLDSRDQSFRIKLGGRILADFADYSPNSTLNKAFQGLEIQGHGTEFRAARLYAEGEIYQYVDFKAEYDFAGGDADFKDVYVGLRKIPSIGHFRVGHFKEPFSLEELTSGKYLTFMERALPNAFVPGRNMGFGIFNSEFDQRMTWAAGVFEDSDDFGDAFADFSDYNVTARFTGLPWYAEDGAKLLHLGLSYSHQFRAGENNPITYQSRPESHITNVRLVDTGPFPVDNVNLINPELAFVYGPFSLQGEYMQSFNNGTADTGDLNFNGLYTYASYFLTGEHRAYNKTAGAFDRVAPLCNFNIKDGGWGAWELAARYSYLCLNDKLITGGEEQDFTFGVNWYLNPNTRVMFNYILAIANNRTVNDIYLDDDPLNIVQSRFQVDF